MGGTAMRGRARSSVLWRQGTWSLVLIGTLTMLLADAPVVWPCGGQSCWDETFTDGLCVVLTAARDIKVGELNVEKDAAETRWGVRESWELRGLAQGLADNWGGWDSTVPGTLRGWAEEKEEEADVLMVSVSNNKAQMKPLEQAIQEHLKKAADFDAQAQAACTGS